ncbi:MAG: hypothetical protein V7K90_18080 [Nostoc sp.]
MSNTDELSIIEFISLNSGGVFTTVIIEKKAKLMSDTAMVAIALPKKNE